MGHAARYELKYLIQESRAVAIADFISSYLRPSAHNGYSPVRGHPVISLYMDSPDFFFFRQAFTLEIDGDKLPAEQIQSLLEELQELFAKFQAGDALKVKEGIKPMTEFHALRHTSLTPEQNLAVDQICPIIAMVKVKARE